MEHNGLTLAAVVEELKKLAPEKSRGLTESTISRHASGAVIPDEKMKDLYLQLTGAAVTPNDWFALSKNSDLGKKTEKQAAA